VALVVAVKATLEVQVVLYQMELQTLAVAVVVNMVLILLIGQERVVQDLLVFVIQVHIQQQHLQ
jgi:hypothetical protein